MIDRELKPAFAGYIVDGSVSEKEIAATIVDLIVRGYIFAPHAGKRWQDSNFDILVKTKEPDNELADFETMIMNQLFSKSDKVKSNDVSEFINSKNIINEIQEDIKNQQINYESVSQSFKIFMKNDPNERDIKNNLIMSRLKSQGHEVSSPQHLTAIKIFYVGLAFYALFLSINIIKIAGFEGIFGTTFTPFIIGQLGFFVLIAAAAAYFLKLNGIIQFSPNAKNKKDEVLLEKYQNLMKFIKSMPLKEGRLFDEYLPYSIAFGIDQNWQKKFGL